MAAMNYRKAARVFVDGLHRIGIEADLLDVAQRMAWLDDHGMAQVEVPRWHEDAKHPIAGRTRCPVCTQ